MAFIFFQMASLFMVFATSAILAFYGIFGVTLLKNSTFATYVVSRKP